MMGRLTRAYSEPVTARRERERDDKYFSKVIGKALDLISILRASGTPLSLNELTCRLDLAKSSVFRILHTLEVAEYVDRDAAGRYVLAPELRPWGAGQVRTRLVQLALPRIKELNREFGETVSVAMRFDNRLEVIATVESSQLIRMGNTVGRILPPHASALGKAITANQTDDVRERLVRSYGMHRFTEHTIVDEMELRREFERVRTQGYGRDLEESVLEGCCFAAPIAGPDGHALGAVSISAPKMRMRHDLRDRLIAALRRTADGTSRDLRPAVRGAARVS
jgi:DNA-binding IclR family transcriptional regulator